ncbi:hypothetical protein [Nocardia tengchongensis]
MDVGIARAQRDGIDELGDAIAADNETAVHVVAEVQVVVDRHGAGVEVEQDEFLSDPAYLDEVAGAGDFSERIDRFAGLKWLAEWKFRSPKVGPSEIS